MIGILTLKGFHVTSVIGTDVTDLEKELMGAIEDLEEAKVDVRKDKAGLFVSNNEAGKAVTPFNQKKVKVQSAAERSAFRSLDVPDKNEELFEWHKPQSKNYNDKILKKAFEDAEKIVYGGNKGKRSNFRGTHTEVRTDNPETRLTKFGDPDDEKTYRKLVEMDDDTQYLAAGWRLANERAAKDFRKKHPSEAARESRKRLRFRIQSEGGATSSRLKFEDINKLPSFVDFSKECRDGYTVKEACEKKARYRTIDGSCNNIELPVMGRARTPYARILKPDYGDGIETVKQSHSGKDLPNARRITRTLMTTEGHQDGDGIHPRLNQLFQAMGQFIAHNGLKTSNRNAKESGIKNCCKEKEPSRERKMTCLEIDILDPDDPFRLDNRDCLDIRRNIRMSPLDCNPTHGTRQGSVFSHYQDLNAVYGVTKETYEDLKRDDKPGLIIRPRGNTSLTGDHRSNENPYLFTLHKVSARLHNHVASRIQRKNKRKWADSDKLYEEARKVNIAIFQHITYKEYLPHVLGKKFIDDVTPDLKPRSHGYNKFTMEDRRRSTPEITSGFGGASFRFGHSTAIDKFELRDPQTRELIRTSNLNELFGKDQAFLGDMGSGSTFAQVVAGTLQAPMSNVDFKVSSFIHEKLFMRSDKGEKTGMDLAAINIMRGRDQGLPGYLEYLNLCKGRIGKPGREKYDSWRDLEKFFHIKDLRKMETLYEDVRDIDLFVGILGEKKDEHDAILGPVGRCVVADTFYKNMLADYHFYDNAGHPGFDPFTEEQLNSIRGVSLADILCLTLRSSKPKSSLKSVPQRAFEVPSRENSDVACSSVKSFDGSPWAEDARRHRTNRRKISRRGRKRGRQY